ncbi:MAG: PSD1 and planctomycete cytochrome C domain-containing protein [Verrucomicrobiota bacterium]|nr:PSD1 and planctomycete cytochrome C domain-containing protein [Verrucomicrobiota bacterium]
MKTLSTIAFLVTGHLTASAAVDFMTEIHPLLSAHCMKCHGGVRAKSGLSFARKESVFAPAKSGRPAVVPGRPGASELLARISSHDDEERMPPEKPLTAEEISTLQKWIEEGALWPEHWAFKPPEKMQGATIDSLVKNSLEKAEIKPSPEAEKHTLVRRIHLDLLGLPPSPAAITAFEKDTAPGAYQRLVDRTLDLPGFGERWARHWLDAARYADSDGYEKDNARPNAWRWRKWVIDAINDDMPFDRFTIEQLAGDLLPDATPSQRLATAFHRQTLFNREGGVDPEEDRTKRTIDRTATTSSTWLALSMECAQCHDHPYDPVSQREFYQFYAFFNNAEEADTQVPKDTPREDAKEEKAEMMKARVMRARERKTFIFHRGDFLQPKKDAGEVFPGTPAVLPGMPSSAGQKSNRLDLARWIVDPENPLTARVAVNDIWSRLFGHGLVANKADFGTRTVPPIQLKLLDHLALELINSGWSRKRLIRYILLSGTYRQSARFRPAAAGKDPGNQLLHRQNRFRVEGEIMRDIFLEASGLLQHRVGSPSVFPPIPADVAAQSYASNFKWKTSTGADRYRRAMYTFFKRTAADPNLIAFDCPDANVTVAKRNRSNTPIMALAALGNEVFHEAAQAMAKKILGDQSLKDESARIDHCFLLCTARKATREEKSAVAQLLEKSRDYYRENHAEAEKLAGPHRLKQSPAVENAAWIATARIILNLDETITRP